MTPVLRGGLWMMAAALAFTVMTVLIRDVAASGIHPIQIAFFRALTNLLLMMPFVVRVGPREAFSTENHKAYAFRGLCGFTFLMTYFPGAALIQVDESQALIFTAPLWAALFAMLFLGEKMRARRLSALAVGFAGALIIIRPGMVELSIGAVLVLVAALANGTSNTLVKYTSRSDHPDKIVLYLMLYVTPALAIAAIFVWSHPSWIQLGLMVAVGFFATLNQRFLSRAFASADATAVLPFDFARLPFAAILGFIVFLEYPDLWVWIGGGIIFAASIYLAHREAVAGRRARDAADPDRDDG